MTTPLSKALMGAAALILVSQPVQAQDGDLWLQCRETSDQSWDLRGDPTSDRSTIGEYDYIRVGTDQSIWVYQGGGSQYSRWQIHDCTMASSACRIDQDTIAFRYTYDDPQTVSVNRRTGQMVVVERDQRRDARTGRRGYACSRTTDPRPPAAF
jgi:hypothetical protein